MREIKGTHDCFNCSRLFKWRSPIFEGQYTGISSFSDSVEATVYFIAKKSLEVSVTCPKCRNKNKFVHEL